MTLSLTRLLDVGGVPYLMPTVTRDKLYDMKDYPELTSDKADTSGLVIGAGAGPWPFINRNAEMMPNLYVKKDKSILQVSGILTHVYCVTLSCSGNEDYKDS